MHDKFKVVQIIVCTVVNIFLFIFEYSTLFVDYKQHFFMKPLPYLKIAVGLYNILAPESGKQGK